MKPALCLFATTILLAPLAAQKVPLPGASGRILQLIDVQALVVTGREDADRPEDVARRLKELAAFVRDFVDPPLAPGDDVQALGDRCLVVLAQPNQAALVERLCSSAANHGDQSVTVAIELVELPHDAAVEQLKPWFDDLRATAAQPLRKVLSSADAVARVLHDLKSVKDANQIAAPRLVVRPLQIGNLVVGEKISYIRDFDIKTTPTGRIAEPLVDTVFDGNDVHVTVAHLDKNQLAVQCEVLTQKVNKPIPTFTTSLGQGTPISIQLPSLGAVRMKQKVILPDGGGVLLAAPRGDGSWLCAVVQAQTVK